MAFSFRKFLQGINLIPKTASTASEKGDLDVTSSSGKLNYHNGTTASPVVTEAHSATLTNKTIDGDDNTIQDVALTSLKTVLGDANKVIRRDAAGIVVSDNTLPNSSAIVTIDASQSLSNKTLTSPVINTATADTITAIAGGNLQLSSAMGQYIKLDDISVIGNAVYGGASTLSIYSALNQDVSITAQGLGNQAVQIGSDALIAGRLELSSSSFSLTGSNRDITTNGSFVEILSAAPVSIGGIKTTAAKTLQQGQVLVIANRSGLPVTINNQSGGSANIFTGTGGPITLENNAAIFLVYSVNANPLSSPNWIVVGGVGGNLVVNLTAGETLAANDAVYVSVGAADGGRTSGSAYKVDATNDNRIEFIGFALDAATAGSQVRVQVGGGVTGLSGLTLGKQVFASVTTPGATQASSPTLAGQWVVPLGIATSASTLTINAAGSATAVKITSEADPFVYASTVTVSTNTTLTTGNTIVLVNASGGSRTMTLPAPTAGKIVIIKKTDSSLNTVVISPPSGTIDGAASRSLVTQYDSLTIASDGTNFFII